MLFNVSMPLYVFLYQECSIWPPYFVYYASAHEEIHHEKLVTSKIIEHSFHNLITVLTVLGEKKCVHAAIST